VIGRIAKPLLAVLLAIGGCAVLVSVERPGCTSERTAEVKRQDGQQSSTVILHRVCRAQ
jgi:hypothetical protein